MAAITRRNLFAAIAAALVGCSKIKSRPTVIVRRWTTEEIAKAMPGFTFISVNGSCIDLDGFCKGQVAGNIIRRQTRQELQKWIRSTEDWDT